MLRQREGGNVPLEMAGTGSVKSTRMTRAEVVKDASTDDLSWIDLGDEDVDLGERQSLAAETTAQPKRATKELSAAALDRKPFDLIPNPAQKSIIRKEQANGDD